MSGSSQPPGWYPAQGDPPGTVRWWDGQSWVGGPQAQGAQQQAGYVAPGGNVLPGGQELADPWIRIAARMIDTVILVVVWLVVSFVLFGGAASLTADLSISQVVAAFVMYLSGALYFYLMNSLAGGTVGKLVLGVRIVDTDGNQPLGLSPGFVRSMVAFLWVGIAVPVLNLLVLLALLVLAITSLVFMFTDPQRRTVMDRLGNTFVVKKS